MSTKSSAEKLLFKPSTTACSSDPSRLVLLGPLFEGVRRRDGPEEAQRPRSIAPT